jgi:nucleoid-associated protein YgaU
MNSNLTTLLAGAAVLGALALAPPSAAAAGATVEHTVRSGDNLHLLAGYYYKDPRQWQRIWKLNGKKLRRPSVLAIGSVLRVQTEPGRGWEIPYEEFVAKVRRPR